MSLWHGTLLRDILDGQLTTSLVVPRPLRQHIAQGNSKTGIADRNDLARLSDTELIAGLFDMAKQLGVEINLNYSFAQPKEPEE